MRSVFFSFLVLFLITFANSVYAAESEVRSSFSIPGCSISGSSGLLPNSCSGDGRYFCEQSGSSYTLLDTIQDSGGCYFGSSSFNLGGAQCCPSGYMCNPD